LRTGAIVSSGLHAHGRGWRTEFMKKMLKLVLVLVISASIMPFTAQARDDDVVVLLHCSLKLSVTTTAQKSTIWRLWSDVENWKKFDTILEYSYLVDNAKFEQGAVGYLNARGAPKTKFVLVKMDPSVSFTESLKLPLFQTVELQRYFEANESGDTTFTHEVNFKGGLRFLMYALLARKFRSELVKVMGNLKDVAESEELEASQDRFESPAAPQ